MVNRKFGHIKLSKYTKINAGDELRKLRKSLLPILCVTCRFNSSSGYYTNPLCY